jgi:alkanesulfonate monooxygenase SsuD/methylene tetrahydromethanopterin reductase-like flavin-dependent oxidoreductase (luciferase family)
VNASRPFRFGVVAGPRGDGERWVGAAKRVEGLGYSILLVPDGVQLLSPFSSLAVVAAATSLRIGTYVLASPLRTPRQAAWEAHSLTVLSGGRFEMGIGTGHDRVPQGAAELGMPYGTASERRDQVKKTVADLRELDSAVHTPVLMAASGPKSLALAGEIADIVAIATGPLATRDEVAATIAGFRETSDRAAEIELAMNLFVVGDQVPPWVRGFIGVDAEQLIAADSLTILRGNVDEMADELRRRRDALGVSYISVNEAFVEQFAPLVERLTGT